MYVGIILPPKSMDSRKDPIKIFLYRKLLLESGYADSPVTTRDSAVEATAVIKVTPYARIIVVGL